LCYSNLWDLNHAGAQASGVRWYDGFRGQQQEEGDLKDLLPISMRGTHPGKSFIFSSSYFVVSRAEIIEGMRRMVGRRTIRRCEFCCFFSHLFSSLL